MQAKASPTRASSAPHSPAAALLPPLEPTLDRILALRGTVSRRRCVVVGISGIDGSGKGFLTGHLAARLQAAGLRVGVVHADDWLSLPQERFCATDPAGQFYRGALRLDEMYARLVLPLKELRSVRVVADWVEETGTQYGDRVHEYADLDVALVEGIYLFKRAFVAHHDLALWVECSFETALARGVARGQEGLPPEDTVRMFQTVFFPAQELHFRYDAPRAAADLVLDNDPEAAAAATVG